MNENTDYIASEQPDPKPGPFLARVVSHLDPTYMGILEVEILRPTGNTQDSGQLHQVKMMTPFYGVTSVEHVGEDPNDYNNTQKSYGMWFVPPDPGTIVMVIFVDGDPKRGYWMGCVLDDAMNFMLPGLASTEFVVEGGGRLPVAEYNKRANPEVSDPTKVKKPKHTDQVKFLEEQGLVKDDIRGITTSSARRETPSSVFGISTPGPLDKRSGAKQGKIGKSDYQIPNAFVSRLGGSTFVMDDGDDKFLRKTYAKDGPPEYAAVEQGETGGKPDVPHNELVRIRTRTGHQILLHNSEDLIYIGNARGTTWIELTSNGKIDIYAEDSISMHTKGDFNVTADKNINLTAKQNINLNAQNIYETASSSVEIKAGADGKITASNLHFKASSAANLTGSTANIKGSGNVNLTAGGDTNIKSGGKHTENASGYYSLPGGGGTAAVTQTATEATTAGDAIVAPRVPDHEPWAGHENLHNSALKYTTSTDTFRKEKGAS